MHAWEEGGKVEVVNCVLVRLRELRVEEVKNDNCGSNEEKQEA